MQASIAKGTRFGPYIVEGLIAGGGMGHVYAAQHDLYPGQVVAVKVLHPSLHEDEDWRKRFNEEGLVGEQLKHPNILSARGLVEHDGRIGLVLDLVSGGQTLEKVISREFPSGLPLVTAIKLMLKTVAGVDYLHGKEVIHGDIKPENVMIEGDFRKPELWRPLVTDFGTVALIANPVVIDGRAAVVATPRYASPEHLRGVDRLEVRSDIYCLGLLLHYLLTGEHVSNARTVREAAERVVMPVPEVHLVDQPDIMLDVFRKATAVDPADRYERCRDFALALRAVLDQLGEVIDLADLDADLATEIDEERARLREEQQSVAAPAPAKERAPKADGAAKAEAAAKAAAKAEAAAKAAADVKAAEAGAAAPAVKATTPSQTEGLSAAGTAAAVGLPVVAAGLAGLVLVLMVLGYFLLM